MLNLKYAALVFPSSFEIVVELIKGGLVDIPTNSPLGAIDAGHNEVIDCFQLVFEIKPDQIQLLYKDIRHAQHCHIAGRLLGVACQYRVIVYFSAESAVDDVNLVPTEYGWQALFQQF